MKTLAILDTSAIICLYHLDVLQNLNLLYTEVRIPREVQKEFLTKHRSPEECSNRYDFLTKFYNKHSTWFLPCNEYGSDLIELYMTLPKMDKGEAEALAQNQHFENNYEVIIDERTAKKYAKNNSYDSSWNALSISKT